MRLKRVGSGIPALCVAAALGFAVSGCNTVERPSLSPTAFSAMASAAPGATVAFESIDGPPEPVFKAMVASLAEESNARQIAVVSREGGAQYRIRGYLSAQVAKKRSTIAWTWDVYDRNERRVFRIRGEEPAQVSNRTGWDGANEAVVRKIARASVDRLSAFLGAAPEPAGPAPRSEPTLALGSDAVQTASLADER